MADSIFAQIHLSYAELITVCDAIHLFMVRDTTEFDGFGIESTVIAAFLTKNMAFRDLPSDDELAAVMIDATILKNSLANDVRVMLRIFSERARLSFPNDSGKYGLFHTRDLSKLSDSNLHVFGRKVQRTADQYTTELAVGGLTPLMVTALETKLDAFEAALAAQEQAIAERDDATTQRAAKALELYGLLTSYCETGRVIWNGVNPAFYNDYVIFGANGQLVTLYAPLEFVYDNTVHKFTWLAQDNATSYEIEVSANHVDWTQLYAGANAEYSYIPPGGDSSEYRCRCRNTAGYGPFCESITILYIDPLPPPASISVTTDNLNPPDIYIDLSWGAVVGATFYKVFESMVNIGQPAGTYTDIGNYSPSNLRKLAVRNHRYYYHVKACNESTSSVDSSTVYVDVPL